MADQLSSQHCKNFKADILPYPDLRHINSQASLRFCNNLATAELDQNKIPIFLLLKNEMAWANESQW
jgi:hypothetical protein